MKNGFLDFNFNDDGGGGKDRNNLVIYGYRDIKMNVLIEYNRSQLVGEIQFLISFILKAKKLGHSVYSFVRNQDYYKEISQYLNNENIIINENELNKVILTKNVSLFSSMLENCTSKEKNQFFIAKQENIVTFLKEVGWKKGLSLFSLFVDSWK